MKGARNGNLISSIATHDTVTLVVVCSCRWLLKIKNVKVAWTNADLLLFVRRPNMSSSTYSHCGLGYEIKLH